MADLLPQAQRLKARRAGNGGEEKGRTSTSPEFAGLVQGKVTDEETA
jgi:hypothetical protein